MISIPSETTPSLRELLAFYAEAGVDDALAEEASNRFLAVSKPVPQADARPQPQRAAAPRAASPEPRPAQPTAVPDGGQVALARERAARATSLEELQLELAAFDGCNLKFTAKNLVFADGNPQSGVMLVGDAPGRDEDLEGIPFVGRPGQLLDRMLAAIGLDRQSVYLANVIPWRPPGNRNPTAQEAEICRPFIERQIELANPRLIVTLGGCSAKILLDASESVLRLRGGWQTHVTAAGVSIPAMPTLDPDYLLRNPAHKKLAWRDFLEVKARLREPG